MRELGPQAGGRCLTNGCKVVHGSAVSLLAAGGLYSRPRAIGARWCLLCNDLNEELPLPWHPEHARTIVQS